MTKAKTAAEKDFATAEINFNAGADALKAGFDKAIAGYDSVVGYGKDTAEALIKSATVAGKAPKACITRFTPTPNCRWKSPSPPARRSWAPSPFMKRLS